jgi:hypothetical protein
MGLLHLWCFGPFGNFLGSFGYFGPLSGFLGFWLGYGNWQYFYDLSQILGWLAGHKSIGFLKLTKGLNFVDFS